MSLDPKEIQANRNFFGRRKGPRLHSGHQRLIDEFLPEIRLDLLQPCPADLSILFECDGLSAFHLEIGFGGGEHLISRAIANPHIGYIGVEPFLNGLAKGLAAIDKHGLKNVRIFDDDAALLLDWLSQACLDQIYLLYPDPWPKKRHWKRRFINPRNLDRIARVLKPHCEFRFATDINTYQNWTLNHIDRHPAFDWTAQEARDWREPWSEWTRTRYETKAIREKRTPGYFIFERC